MNLGEVKPVRSLEENQVHKVTVEEVELQKLRSGNSLSLRIKMINLEGKAIYDHVVFRHHDPKVIYIGEKVLVEYLEASGVIYDPTNLIYDFINETDISEKDFCDKFRSIMYGRSFFIKTSFYTFRGVKSLRVNKRYNL